MNVVVTGIGAVCALGENTTTIWSAIERGKSGISPIGRFDVSLFDTKLGALVPTGDTYDTEEKRLLAYGHAAANEAIQHSGIVDLSCLAMVLGTCNGELGKEIQAVSNTLAA